MNPIRFLTGLLAAAALLAPTAQAQPAAFPTRPLKIVVPTSAGSGSDITARYFAEQLSTALGQPVLIDNKPGANGVIAAIPQVKGGKLRALGVSGERRHPDYPEIPTIKESGFPDDVNHTWTSMYIRSETPDAVTSGLVEAMQKVLATQGAREFIARIGSDPMALGPAEMRRFRISDTERFRKVADAAGIEPE